tara:strand:- start:1928 stop:2326 length:399 start_codon:yes stop_codon:yes gene_type:complete
MKLTESKIWKRLNLIQKKKKDWFLTRIESSTINGIPDIYACVTGHSFWIELKANEVKNCNLSKFQINWHIKHKQVGGQSFILNFHASQCALQLLEVRDSRALHLIAESPVTSDVFNEKLILLINRAARGAGK